MLKIAIKFRELKRIIYKKFKSIFIGEIFDEMLDEDLLNEMRCKVVTNSSGLIASLTQNPKIVVLKCLDDVSKNSLILQTVVNSCPTAKILIIGAEREDFKKSLQKHISAYISNDSNFQAFRTTLEELDFEHIYDENFIDSELNIIPQSRGLDTFIWAALSSVIFISVLILFYFINDNI